MSATSKGPGKQPSISSRPLVIAAVQSSTGNTEYLRENVLSVLSAIVDDLIEISVVGAQKFSSNKSTVSLDDIRRQLALTLGNEFFMQPALVAQDSMQVQQQHGYHMVSNPMQPPQNQIQVQSHQMHPH
eukprot:GHVP01069548.1.p1 GENE.GHVP01069548.1~~GHVP01069548.1.p1  ORF type:complete len:129 (+),score=21.87 GHVP01069548.1:90-476(+)